jgi:protein TonB
MMSLLEDGEHLERELVQEPIVAPAMGSVVLHVSIAASLVLYGLIGGLFHHNPWGNPGAGGAIQVSLVSNALPLPSDQQNENVLATETPSKAAAEPAPTKAKQAEDMTAIPISGKQAKDQKQQQAKPQKNQPPAKADNRARFGEQSGSFMPRATLAQGSASNGPVSVSNGDFGSRFGWYVDGIKRKVSQNWIRGQVDPRTPKGASVQIYFRINRQGDTDKSKFKVNTASGSPTLDRSCLLATQRVDTFGPLPSDSHDQWLDVTYDCTY